MASLSDLDPVGRAATYLDHEYPGRRPPTRRGPPEIDVEWLARRIVDSVRKAIRNRQMRSLAHQRPFHWPSSLLVNW